MRRMPSTGFNKEKLIFIGAVGLLSLSLYHLLTSAPVKLDPSESLTSMGAPGPLDREKTDTRVPDVLYYIDRGVNPTTGLAVLRDRKNPFEPIDDFVTDTNAKDKKTPGPKVPQAVVEAPPPPPEEKVEPKEKEKKSFGPTTKIAKVDFSGVMTMAGATYGLLKSKDGQTIQVKEGDYLEDFKYTVAKIEKQAIWVSDEDNQLFVARDLTFDEGGSAGGDDGGDDKAAKKKPVAKKKPADKPVADKAPAAQHADTAQQQSRPRPDRGDRTNSGNLNNNNSSGGRGGGRPSRGGNSTTGSNRGGF